MKCFKYLAVCIYLLNATLVFAFENHRDIDSLKAIISEQKSRVGSGPDVMDLYLSLSAVYEAHKLYDSALIYCQSALKWVEHDSVFYRIHARLGFLHYRLGDPRLGLRHCLLAEEKSIPHMDHKVRCQNLYNIAHLYTSQGKYESALERFFKALKYCTEAEDSTGIANVYRGLALLHWKTENYLEALRYSKESTRLFQQLGEGPHLYMGLSHIASSFSRLNQLDSALLYARKAWSLSRDIEYEHGEFFSQGLVGIILYKQGLPDSANYYYHNSLQYFYRVSLHSHIIQFNQKIATLLNEQGKTQAAVDTLEKMLTLAVNMNAYPVQVELHDSLAWYHRILGDLDHAQKHQAIALATRDSIERKNLSQKMEGLQQEYERETFDKQLSSLKKALARADRTMLYITLTLGSVILILIALFMYYHLYTHNQLNQIADLKDNCINLQRGRLTQMNQEMRWVAQELRGIVKNDQNIPALLYDHVNTIHKSTEVSLPTPLLILQEKLTKLATYIETQTKETNYELLALPALIIEAKRTLPTDFQGKYRKLYFHQLPGITAQKEQMILLFQHILLLFLNHRSGRPLDLHIESNLVEGMGSQSGCYHLQFRNDEETPLLKEDSIDPATLSVNLDYAYIYNEIISRIAKKYQASLQLGKGKNGDHVVILTLPATMVNPI